MLELEFIAPTKKDRIYDILEQLDSEKCHVTDCDIKSVLVLLKAGRLQDA